MGCARPERRQVMRLSEATARANSMDEAVRFIASEICVNNGHNLVAVIETNPSSPFTACPRLDDISTRVCEQPAQP
jgi:hypothetical protein